MISYQLETLKFIATKEKYVTLDVVGYYNISFISPNQEVSMKESAQRLKALRMEKEFSQERMSRELGINRASYSRIELGVNNIPESHLIKISQTFGISLNWFLLGIKPKFIKDIHNQDFGEYSESVNELFDIMKRNKAAMHAILSIFYEKKKHLELMGSFEENSFTQEFKEQ
jgi:transcriptional regulator with XRE-family HTH domain